MIQKRTKVLSKKLLHIVILRKHLTVIKYVTEKLRIFRIWIT